MSDLTKACWAGGTAQIYINPTLPPGIAAADVKRAVLDAFQQLTDPAGPEEQVVSAVLTKEQLRDVDGTDVLHPSRSGDVVIVLRRRTNGTQPDPASESLPRTSSASMATSQNS